MLIRHKDADQFLARGLQGLSFFLFYGTDEGLVQERARIVFQHFRKQHPKCEIINMEGDELAQNPHLLFEEAQSLGLFAEKKFIFITLGSKSILPALETCLQEDNFQTPVIIKAGALKPDHQLRKLCERKKNIISIECYPDTNSDLTALIKKSAQEHNIKISSDAIEHLIHSLGESRLSTRLEFEKLYLYCHGQSSIELSDILDISSDASDPIIDELTTSVFMRQHQQAMSFLSRLLQSGHDPHQIIGSLLRCAMTILRTKIYIENGEPPESARQKASRMMSFFGRPQRFENYARLWTNARLIKAIDIFAHCIDRIRLEPKLAQTYTTRAVLLIAR